jgi:hypothetical protein
MYVYKYVREQRWTRDLFVLSFFLFSFSTSVTWFPKNTWLMTIIRDTSRENMSLIIIHIWGFVTFLLSIMTKNELHKLVTIEKSSRDLW